MVGHLRPFVLPVRVLVFVYNNCSFFYMECSTNGGFNGI